MKNLFVFIAAMLFCGNVFSQGINFEHGTFDEALAKAKAENKMVFMDCYTTWCGPCKMLSKNIFPQKEVGDYFNANFVSVKMDMEKGEGIDLLKKYQVKAFPTLLFMDATGKVLHTMVGGSDAAGLIAEAKIASDPSQRIGALEAKYAKGDRDVKFISKYIQALQKAYNQEKMTEVGKEFVANTPVDQLCNEDAFTILSYSGLEYGSKAYKYIIANTSKFVAIEKIGQEGFDQVIGGSISNNLKNVAETGTLAELQAGIEEGKKDFTSPQQRMMEDQLFSQFYLAHKEFDKWFDAQEKSADAALETDKKMALSMYINTAYRIAMDPAFENAGIYNKAIAMTLKAQKADETFIAANYCLSALYKKIGNKTKALENINAYIAKNAEKGGKSDARVDQLKKDIENMK